MALPRRFPSGFCTLLSSFGLGFGFGGGCGRFAGLEESELPLSSLEDSSRGLAFNFARDGGTSCFRGTLTGFFLDLSFRRLDEESEELLDESPCRVDRPVVSPFVFEFSGCVFGFGSEAVLDDPDEESSESEELLESFFLEFLMPPPFFFVVVVVIVAFFVGAIFRLGDDESDEEDPELEELSSFDFLMGAAALRVGGALDPDEDELESELDDFFGMTRTWSSTVERVNLLDSFLSVHRKSCLLCRAQLAQW